ncbi:hypothetical protein WJX73_008782 [Symbiochloris irregularis]|uniref:GRIP domain-containing protein n=1 Tax=Symbiochloris irregularis TaxID=706552 RepID=A0AAW1P8E0_9CHLO
MATTSPPKPALPPSVANASREDLQRMLMDSVRKTKARDKRIAEVTAERDALAAKHEAAAGASENGGPSTAVEQEVQELKQQLAAARDQNAVLEQQAKQQGDDISALTQQLTQLRQQAATWQTEAEAASETSSQLQAQLDGVKSMLREEAEEKERLKNKVEGVTASARGLESKAKSFKFGAEKARAEVAVLEGALSGVKSELEAARSEAETLRHALSQAESLTASAEELAAAEKLSGDESSQGLEVPRLQEIISQLQADLAAAKAAEQELKEQLTNHRTAVPSTPTPQKSVTTRRYAAAAKKKQAEHVKKVKEMEEQLAAAESAGVPPARSAPADESSAVVQELNEMIATLQQESREIYQQLQVSQQRESDILAERDSAQSQLQEASSQLHSTQSRLAEAEAQLQEAATQLREAALEARSKAEALTLAEERRAEMQAQQALQPPDTSAVQQQLDRAQQDAEAAVQAQQRAEAKAEDTARQLEELEEQLQQRQEALSTAQEVVAQLTRQVQEASERVQSEGTVAAAKLQAARPEATDEGADAMSQLQADLVTTESEGLKQAVASAQLAQQQLQEAEQSAEKQRQLHDSRAGESQAQLQAAEQFRQSLESQLDQAAAIEDAQNRWRKEQEAERERVKRAIAELKKKHERAQRESKKAESAAVEAKAAAEAQLAAAESTHESAGARVEEAEKEAARVTEELKEYKVRAHSLLKSKDAELRDARAAAESQFGESLRSAEAALADVHRQLEQVRKGASEAEIRHTEQSAAAAAATQEASRQLREALEAAQAAADAASSTGDQWKRRHDALEARMEVMRSERRQSREASPEVLARHAQRVAELESALSQLQAEHDSYQNSAEEVAEAKDAELAHVLAANATLREELAAAKAAKEAASREATGSPRTSHSHFPHNLPRETPRAYRTSSFSANLGMLTVGSGRLGEHHQRVSDLGEHRVSDLHRLQDDSYGVQGLTRRDSAVSLRSMRSSRIAESGMDDYGYESGLQDASFSRMAAQQAFNAKEEEAQAAKKQAAELESEVADLQSTLELHQQQAEALKEALREAEREKARQKLSETGDGKASRDMEYLKNILLKLFETGEAAALLPVIATMLQFSPNELTRCKTALAKFEGQSVDGAAVNSTDTGAAAGGESQSYFSALGSCVGSEVNSIILQGEVYRSHLWHLQGQVFDRCRTLQCSAASVPMTDQTVVITGASTGIGYAIAELLVQRGFRVWASVRKEADAVRLRKHFGTERFTALLFDVTEEQAVHQAADTVKSALKGRRLTALINNAGISQIEPTAVCNIARARQVVDTNLIGYLICTQAFLPLLGTDKSLTGPPGRVLQISSVLGEAEMPYQAVYSAAKHGLEAVTACLRRELDPYHIIFVSIRPGPVTSDFWGKIDWTTHDGGPWEKGMQTAHALIEMSLKRPASCEAVAQTALRAVTTSRPRIVYYTVGSWDQWLSIKMIGSWLPSWLVDFLWIRGLRNF